MYLLWTVHVHLSLSDKDYLNYSQVIQACHIHVHVAIDIVNSLYLHYVASNTQFPLSSFVRIMLLVTLLLSFVLIERLPKDEIY